METPRGFTLLELTLSIAIISVLAAIAIPFALSNQARNDFQIALETTAQSARRAQALAQAGDGDSPWGVHVESGSISIFRGDSYVSRDPDFDEVFTIPTEILTSGLSDVVFEKFSGLPNGTGEMTFTSASVGVASIVLYPKGTVDYVYE